MGAVLVIALCTYVPTVEGGLTYACVNCDNMPKRLRVECDSATKPEMPCYQYRLVKDSLCSRTCQAVHRKPCRLKARICRADPDCAHLCRKFFEYLCPLTERAGLVEDPDNICVGYDTPADAEPNPLSEKYVSFLEGSDRDRDGGDHHSVNSTAEEEEAEAAWDME